MGDKLLLIGDNPFQSVSHLSQERAMARGNDLSNPAFCADLVMTAIKNGADGFMFTANDKALAILKAIGDNGMRLYPLIPDASGLARKAGREGGVVGLAKGLLKEVVFKGNMGIMLNGMRGIATTNVEALFMAYLGYEVARIRSAVGKNAVLSSVLLHEILTDMALALNMDWLFEAHMDYTDRLGIKAGFETRNFVYLVRKFREWGLSLNDVVIAAPFNKMGFQMCPSRRENERTLKKVVDADVIAFSILAAGRLGLQDAVEYVGKLSGLKGVVVGVSNEGQAVETFIFLSKELR